MNNIVNSELILNEDGSIYHLKLKPENIAETILTVGDPERVKEISNHFDAIDFTIHNREFTTHTGRIGNKRLTVISTGIGVDNIDIVLNELDSLVNIDLEKRFVKENTKSLKIIRIGTSGTVQNDIPIDSFLMSSHAVGTEGLLHHYKTDNCIDYNMSQAFAAHCEWPDSLPSPYIVPADAELMKLMRSKQCLEGITYTANGFYAPQGRSLRLKLARSKHIEQLQSFQYGKHRLTNIEMETAGLYGLGKALGHQMLSMNAILANRELGTFSNQGEKTIQNLIRYCLEKLI